MVFRSLKPSITARRYGLAKFLLWCTKQTDQHRLSISSTDVKPSIIQMVHAQRSRGRLRNDCRRDGRSCVGRSTLTPLLMVIIMITGDFLAMSLTTDRVRPSQNPNAWEIGKITTAGVVLGGLFLTYCTAILAFGKFELGLGIDALRTVSVVAIVYGSQATIYAIRERNHLWGLRPTIWLVLSSIADLLIISTLAVGGIAMTPLPIGVVAGELGAGVIFGLVLDGVKIPLFARLRIS